MYVKFKVTVLKLVFLHVLKFEEAEYSVLKSI